MDSQSTDLSTLADLAAEAGGRGFATWGLTLLWHADSSRVGERALLPVLSLVGQVCRISRLEPTFAAPGGSLRPLADTRLSRHGIEICATTGGLTISRAGSATTLVVNDEAVEESRFLAAENLKEGALLLLGGVVLLMLHRFDPQLDPGLPRWGMVGDSAGLVEVRRAIAQVADLDVPVLVRGPTGTGKELVARALHAASRRCAGPFVAVNMAALPAELAAAELFGAERGAYTGAERRRAGFFEEADGGTLFLDEIGETPEAVQPLLLRALDSGEIQPLGARGTKKLDVRLVAATDADLEAAIRENKFRSPLFHRLRGFEIRLPPLAERRADIGLLLLSFLREELERFGEQGRLENAVAYLPAALAARFFLSAWPGNIRELRSTVRQMVIANRGRDQVRLDEVLEAMLTRRSDDRAETPPAEPARAEGSGERKLRKPAEIGEDELIAAMREAGFRPQLAAEKLGIPRPSIYDLIDRCSRLRTAADLGHEELVLALAKHEGNLEEMAAHLEVSPSGLQRRLRQLGLA